MRRNRVLALIVLVAATVASALVFQPAAQAASTCTQGFPYVVQQGDDLFRIANRFATTVVGLQVFNSLPDANRIAAGSTICINDGTYIVQPGDTLDSIASRLGVSMAELERVNNLNSSSSITSGQVLVIPGGTVPASVPAPATQVYIVQRGNTVNSIARAFGVTPQELIQLNQLANPNLIRVGQQLLIPSMAMTGLYTVQAGDTLTKIAARFGTSVGLLTQANHLTNVNMISVGQVLVVPAGGTTTTMTAPPAQMPAPVPAPNPGYTVPAPAPAPAPIPAPTMPAPSTNYGY